LQVSTELHLTPFGVSWHRILLCSQPGFKLSIPLPLVSLMTGLQVCGPRPDEESCSRTALSFPEKHWCLRPTQRTLPCVEFICTNNLLRRENSASAQWVVLGLETATLFFLRILSSFVKP
jgi:hypothetical protein